MGGTYRGAPAVEYRKILKMTEKLEAKYEAADLAGKTIVARRILKKAMSLARRQGQLMAIIGRRLMVA